MERRCPRTTNVQSGRIAAGVQNRRKRFVTVAGMLASDKAIPAEFMQRSLRQTLQSVAVGLASDAGAEQAPPLHAQTTHC